MLNFKIMNFKFRLFFTIFSLILLVTLAILWMNTEKKEYQPGISQEQDRAVNQAQLLYRESKAKGVDFSKGPCLTNALMPDWVADVAHSPREAVDDLPDNQCKVYLEGSAKHFVELDVDGNIIRVR